MSQTASKVVHLIGRAEFKATGKVLYRVQAEGSQNIHDVTVIGGKVTSCVANGESCQGFYYRKSCCHSTFVASKEAEQKATEWRSCELCGRPTKQIICGRCLWG